MVDRIKLGGGQAGRGDAEQADAQIMQRVQLPSHKSRHGLNKPEKNQDQWADGGEPVETAGSEAGCLRLGFRGGRPGYLGGFGRGGRFFLLNGGRFGGSRFRRGRRYGFCFRGR